MLEGSRWLTRLLDVLWHCVQFEWGSIGADVRYDTDLKRRKNNETGKTTAPLTPIGTVLKWKLEAREIHGFERQVIYNRQWNKEKKKKQVEVWRTLGDAVTVVCHLFINQTYLSFSLNCDLRPHLRRDLLVPPFRFSSWVTIFEFKTISRILFECITCLNVEMKGPTFTHRLATRKVFSSFHPHIGSST